MPPLDYVLLGRLAQVLESEHGITKSKWRLVGISPRWLKTLFVWSDVFTLLVQMAGGLMRIADNVARLGHYIGLLGIAIQLVSYVIYTLLLRRCQASCPNLRQDEAGIGRNAITLFRVLWTSSIFIVVSDYVRALDPKSGSRSHKLTAPVWHFCPICIRRFV